MVHGNEAKYAAGSEAENGDNGIDKTENNQIQAGGAVLAGCQERNKTATEVDDIVHGVDLEDSQNGIHKEAKDSDDQEDDREYPREWLNETVHGGEKKKIMKTSLYFTLTF